MIKNPSYKAMAVFYLSKALLTDPDPQVRCSAAEALGKISNEEVVFALHQALEILNKINQSIETMSESPKVQMTFNGTVNGAAGNVEGNQVIELSRQNLSEAASEIKELLDRLSKNYPVNSNCNSQAVDEAVEITKSNPALMKRVRAAIKAGAFEALEKSCDHPLVSPFIKAIQAGIDPE
jgi:HEAT repeat